MRRCLVARGIFCGPVVLDEEESCRVIGVTNAFEARDAWLQDAGAGIRLCGGDERADVLRLHVDANMYDEHWPVSG